MHGRSFDEIRECPEWMLAFNCQDDFRSWKKTWTFSERMKARLNWYWERFCYFSCIALGVPHS